MGFRAVIANELLKSCFLAWVRVQILVSAPNMCDNHHPTALTCGGL